MIDIIKGDLIKLGLDGTFDVIAHGCNCFCTMKRGIAPKMASTFAVDNFDQEKEILKGQKWKLGTIDYQGKYRRHPSGHPFVKNQQCHSSDEKSQNILYVVNMYTQYHWELPSPYGIPLNYDALRLALWTLDQTFEGRRIGLPWIGCGLAGGNKDIVKSAITSLIKRNKPTIVEYES